MMRPCLGYGTNPYGHTLTPHRHGRCDDCTRQHETDRTKGKRERRPYTHAMRTDRAAVVAAWRAEHGDWCPGWGRDPHPTPHLTADHLIPVAAGGDEQGEMSVLCRSCNSRKGTNHTPWVG